MSQQHIEQRAFYQRQISQTFYFSLFSKKTFLRKLLYTYINISAYRKPYVASTFRVTEILLTYIYVKLKSIKHNKVYLRKRMNVKSHISHVMCD